MNMQQHEQGGRQVTTTAAVTSTKICGKAGCGRQLANYNKSGFCKSHSHLSRPKKQANGHVALTAHGANGANGHVALTAHGANGANGHAKKTKINGNSVAIPAKVDRGQVVEERINGVMLAWSAKEKMRVVSAWLAGAI